MFHDLGRFEQLKSTGTFDDNKIQSYYQNMIDHGDLVADIIDSHGLLKDMILDVHIYDEEVMKVIKLHSKINPNLLNRIVINKKQLTSIVMIQFNINYVLNY